MTESMVEVPGGRLFVVDEGAGPPVVLLHAGIVDSRAWDPLVPYLLARGFRAIRPDGRNFGRSEAEAVEYRSRADVVAVLDALGVARACLVGNSVGGQVGADVAIEHPGRVAALVLLAATIGGYEPEPSPEEAALFAEMERREAELKRTGDVAAAADFLVRLWVDGIGQPEGRAPASIREEVRRMAIETSDPRRVRSRPIPMRPPAAERLAVLTMPLLAVVGGLDVSDIAATADHLVRSLPDARKVVLPGVAHMIAMEAPERAADLIVGFLAPLGRFG